MTAFAEAARARGDDIIANAPLAPLTSLGIGGPAALLWRPNSPQSLVAGLAQAQAKNLPITAIGRGCNMLIADEGVDHIVLQLGPAFASIEFSGARCTAGAACNLATLSREAADRGLGGLVFCSGIPGTLGGALTMNAGAYGGQMADIVTSVTVATPEGLRQVPAADMDFGYRHSNLAKLGIAVSAQLQLPPADRGTLYEQMKEQAAARRQKQPLEHRSAGSWFMRPPGQFAGTLIEGAGCKGLRVGGAFVSEKHAGFLCCDPGTTCADMLALETLVRQKVQEKYDVTLQREVKLLS